MEKIVPHYINLEGPLQKHLKIAIEVTAGGQILEFTTSRSEITEGRGISYEAAGSGLLLHFSLIPREEASEISIALKPDGRNAINKCLMHIDFLPHGRPVPRHEQLEECRVPHLLPKRGLVISDMVFRSPAIIVRKGNLALALMPDLARLERARPAHWVMDFERAGPENTPRLSLGIMHCAPHGHVYFMGEPDKEIALPAAGLFFAAQLMFSDSAGPDFPRRVLYYLWKRYGVENYHSVRPQVLPLEEQAREALTRICKKDLCLEFEYQGRRCAGFPAFAATTRRKLKPLPWWATAAGSRIYSDVLNTSFRLMSRYGLSEAADQRTRWIFSHLGLPFIAQAWFQSWFNNLRTAYGARVMAEKFADEKMKAQAEAVKNLALSAPVEDGIFSAVCFFPQGRVWWKRGTRTFTVIDDYHTPDAATTGYFLLRWFRDIEPDPALLEMARGLSRFFIKHQLPSGALPTWINGCTHRPVPSLMESASTAGPLMFMALMALMDKDERALNCARRMAAFLARAVIPRHLWYDYETFFSCARKRLGFQDKRTTVPPQNAMSMCWAAEGMRLMYEATGEEQYKELLLAVLDDLLFLQQIWDASVISINTFGGFASMNADAEWNDARQGMIAPVLMDTYRITGDPHHFQRGVAALRACYTTMLHPAMLEVAPGNMVFYRSEDRGAIYENYSHSGRDNVIAGYLEPDWGAGTAAFATAHAALFYRDVYVNLRHGHAFGINGCTVKNFAKQGNAVRLELEHKVPGLTDLKVLVDAAGPDTEIYLGNKKITFERGSSG